MDKKEIITKFYDYVYEEHDCVLREEQIDLFIEERYPEESDLITTEFLCTLHPELSLAGATLLKEFAIRNTVTRRGCYGNGNIIYPKWRALIKEVLGTDKIPNK